jgi:coenzyme F420-dependent glucose-6-phosphate dehydrogenase
MKGITIGYYASLEQFQPGELLKYVAKAQKNHFKGVLLSDSSGLSEHNPMENNFAWDWLALAMEVTDMRYGFASTPGHLLDVIKLAQSTATLCNNHPLSLWTAVGANHSLEQHKRGVRGNGSAGLQLKEYHDIAKALWRGQSIDEHKFPNLQQNKLPVLPPYIPDLLALAMTEAEATCAGQWADGLLTTSHAPDQLRRIIDAFQQSGGEGKPIYLKVRLSYDKSYERALTGAKQQLGNAQLWLDSTPEKDFSQQSLSTVRISDSTEQHAEWIAGDIEAGVSNPYLHNVNRQQNQFIDAFGDEVIPQFHTSWLAY